MPTFSTAWTGAAGNGLWSDASNWTNGVPLSGATFTSGADDVATIDNSVEATPFTLTIDGAEAGDTVDVNLTDPAGAPSVILTGSLDLTNNVQPGGGGGLGNLNLQAGTLEIAGGTLRALTVEQGGDFGFYNGAIAFADQNSVASGISAVLDGVGVQDDFVIGDNALVQVKLGSFAIFEAAHGATDDLVTVDGGAILDVQGSLSMHGTLDVVSGALELHDGKINGDSFGANIVEETGQRLLVVGTSGGTLTQTTVTGDIAFSDGQSSGQPLFLTLVGDDTLQAASGAAAPALLDLSDANGGAVSNVVGVVGNVTLDNVLAENGLIQLNPGGTLKFGAANTIGGFANLTINAADTSSASAPTLIDLNGGSYTVTGGLTLNNVLFTNGTLNLAAGASIVVNDNGSSGGTYTNSIDDFVNVLVERTTIAPTILNGDPDVHVADGTNYVVQAGGELDVNTGVSGGPGKLYLDGNSAYGGSVGEISGAGVVRVADSGGGVSTAVVAGLLEATDAGQTLQLSAMNWSLYDPVAGLGGTAKAIDGATLVLGDVNLSGGVTDLSAGVLSNGTYDSANGGAIQIDGAGPITTLARSNVILDGATSRLFVASANGALLTDLQSSLTSIGQAQVGFTATLGGLQLLDGANFTDPNALDLYGSITLQGGAFTANGITSHLSIISMQAFFGTIQGFGTVNASDSGAGGILAQGGLLTWNGNVANVAARVIAGTSGAANGQLIVNGNFDGGLLTVDAGTSADIKGHDAQGQIGLGAAATATVEGAYTKGYATIGASAVLTLDGSLAASDDTFMFAGNAATAGMLDLKTPGGASATIGRVSGNPTLNGDSIHLEGALLDEMNGPGSGLDLAPGGGAKVLLSVHLKDDSGNQLPDEVFTLNGPDLFNLGVTATLDRIGGTYLTFGGDKTSSAQDPYLTVPSLPNVHVKAGGDDSVDTVVSNPGAPNADTVDGAFLPSSQTGAIVVSGGFTDLQPGSSTDPADNPVSQLTQPFTGSAIKVGVKTDTAGAITGGVEISLSSVIDPMTAASLPGDPTVASSHVEPVSVTANVYDYANAIFPTTTFYLHAGDNPQLYLPVENKVITSAGYQEGLLASFDGPTIVGDFISIAGGTKLVAAGASDTASLGFQADTSVGAPDTQTASLSVKLISDGTGTSGLGQTNQPDRSVAVTVDINEYADIYIGTDDGIFVNNADTHTPDPSGSLAAIVGMEDLGTFYVGQNVDEFILQLYNDDALATHQDSASASPMVDPGFQDSAFSNSFTPATAPPGDLARLGTIRINTSAAAIGEHSEGVVFNPKSVNPTSATSMQQLGIEFTYTLIANPDPTATGTGDPHFTTFDGLHYDFQAEGDFILAQSTGAALAAGDNFAVQARLVGAGGFVSYIHEVAVETGGHRVSLDSDRAAAGTGVLWIDGTKINIGVDGTMTLSDGATVHRVSSGDEFIVATIHGESVDMTENGGWVRVVTQLGVNGPKNEVQGLLGNADGNYQNDLQLSDGAGGYTSTGTTLTTAQIYTDPHSLANTWRITDQTKSLLDYAAGQSTATDNVLNYPSVPVTLASLPTAIAQAAQNAVANAGVTNSTLAADAAYDYALTGNTNFIAAAVAAQQQTLPTGTTANVTVTPPAAPTASLGVSSTAPAYLDNASAVGQVYLTSALTTSLTVNYAVVDTGLAGYLTTTQFGADPTAGSVTLTAGQTVANFSLALPGIGADVSDTLRVAITGETTGDGSSAPSQLATSADFLIVNHAPTRGLDAAPAFVEISGGGALTQTDAAHWTLNLGSIVTGGNAPTLLFGVANASAPGANLLSGVYGFSGAGAADGSFTTQNQIAPKGLVSGATSAGLQILANNGTLGAHTETITLTPTEANASGFSATLSPIFLTINDSIVAAPPPAPTVTIASPASSTTMSYTIGGTGEVGAVVTLTDNGSPIGLNAPVDGDGAWSETLTLTPGANALVATVKDALGQTGTAAATVFINLPPVLTNETLNAATLVGGTISSTPGENVLVAPFAADPANYPLSVSAVAGGGVGAPVAGTDGVLTLNQDGSFTYHLTSYAAPTDSFSYTVTDSHGGQAQASLTFNVHAPPSLTNTPDSVVQPAPPNAATPQVLAPNAIVTDPDSATLAGATISLGASFLAGDVLSANTGAGVTQAYANGVLTLTGVSSLANYQTIIESVAYATTASDTTADGADPSRSVTFTLDDGNTFNNLSAPVTETVTVLPCYVRGTRILTTRGEIAVEDLAVGDLAVTASGASRPIVWIGHRDLDISRHPDRAAVQPVRVVAQAFGEGLPRRDLWLSPGHNIVCGGALAPISCFINDHSVAQLAIDRAEYWHVELDAHDVIFAEGLPAESYLDTGNRSAFGNGGALIEAHPDFEPKLAVRACLPQVLEGPAVVATKARLLARLAQMGHVVSREADAHVLADGMRIEPIRLGPARLLFVSPPNACELALISRVFIPARSVAESADPRELGLCVVRLQIDGQSVALDDDERCAAGWRRAERADGRFSHRWTTGATPLPAHARIVIVDLAGEGHYWTPSASREAERA